MLLTFNKSKFTINSGDLTIYLSLTNYHYSVYVWAQMITLFTMFIL